ncbi:hypothetical protein E2R68_11920 [Psychromonas sp. RZ22]|uniref:hypothetical protein n=1 Tax=Psychromonas algarum TaxID=2555643 RepID=UPI001067D876|nr:hypothetical protein [Psychromonas sp. RZ22]TEW53649.1 hypothetical protein E2R68_11920 [Psychromonas sp. RZ22]
MMIKNNILFKISIIIISVAILASCGNQSSDEITHLGSTIEGTVIDGFSDSATVFLDINHNGQWDSHTEPGTVSDSDGKFSIALNYDQALIYKDVECDGAIYWGVVPLVASFSSKPGLVFSALDSGNLPLVISPITSLYVNQRKTTSSFYFSNSSDESLSSTCKSNLFITSTISKSYNSLSLTEAMVYENYDKTDNQELKNIASLVKESLIKSFEEKSKILNDEPENKLIEVIYLPEKNAYKQEGVIWSKTIAKMTDQHHLIITNYHESDDLYGNFTLKDKESVYQYENNGIKIKSSKEFYYPVSEYFAGSCTARESILINKKYSLSNTLSNSPFYKGRRLNRDVDDYDCLNLSFNDIDTNTVLSASYFLLDNHYFDVSLTYQNQNSPLSDFFDLENNIDFNQLITFLDSIPKDLESDDLYGAESLTLSLRLPPFSHDSNILSHYKDIKTTNGIKDISFRKTMRDNSNSLQCYISDDDINWKLVPDFR